MIYSWFGYESLDLRSSSVEGSWIHGSDEILRENGYREQKRMNLEKDYNLRSELLEGFLYMSQTFFFPTWILLKET